MRIGKLLGALSASLALIAALASPSNANTINYTFSALNGISGSFTFDDSVAFPTIYTTPIVDGNGNATPSLFHRSANAAFTGTFGDYTYSGLAFLLVQDFTPPYYGALDLGQQDYWHLVGTQNMVSNAVNGRTLVGLGFFEDVYVTADMSGVFEPAPIDRTSQFSGNNKYFYVAEYSDSTHESVGLQSLILVPETSSLLLLGFGLAGIMAAKLKGRTIPV